jgi:hypothetical protein
MLLEFIARMILLMVFMLLDVFIIGVMNKDVIIGMTSQNFDFTPLLNAPTIIVTLVLVIIELIVMLYINSFFSAGFFGMVKNHVKDGSTSFGEFMPSVKRYWTAMFRFLFIRYAVMLVFSIPLGFAIFSVLGTSPGFVTTAQWAILAIAFAVALVCGLIIYFWLFYGEAAIVFEDLEAWKAVKRSSAIARSNVKVTLGALFSVVLFLILASLAVSLCLAPFDYMIAKITLAQGDPQAWVLTRQIIELVLNIVTISAMIITSIFIFLTYNQVVGKRPAAKPVKEQVKATSIKRKKK